MDKSTATVFEAIKQGVMSLEEFHAYIIQVEDFARDNGIEYGRETGWHDGYEAGIIDGRYEND